MMPASRWKFSIMEEEGSQKMLKMAEKISLSYERPGSLTAVERNRG